MQLWRNIAPPTPGGAMFLTAFTLGPTIFSHMRVAQVKW